MKVFISNLNYLTTEADLMELFSSAGEVAEAHVFMKADGRSSSGQAVVRFQDQESAETALTLDRTTYRGRTIKVSPWVDRQYRPWT